MNSSKLGSKEELFEIAKTLNSEDNPEIKKGLFKLFERNFLIHDAMLNLFRATMSQQAKLAYLCLYFVEPDDKIKSIMDALINYCDMSMSQVSNAMNELSEAGFVEYDKENSLFKIKDKVYLFHK